MVIRAIEFLGGGLVREDREEAEKIYPYYTFKSLEEMSRNNGLVAITEEQMDNSQSYSEGDAFIDFGTGRCGTDCFFWENSFEDVKEVCCEDISKDDIGELPYELWDFPIKDLHDVIEWIDKKNDKSIFDTGDAYLSFIE
jgi:hypothetical protein